jgi:hypothetical protein
MTHRRRFLSHSLSLGLSTCLPWDCLRYSTGWAEAGTPFSPARTVVLPRRLRRRHLPARRAIGRKVEELAGMDLWRLPEPKIEALLQVADAVTGYYGVGDRLEAWAERIPIQEAFMPQSAEHSGFLSYWQPLESVPRARYPLDWWLFLSPAPIEWGSLDDLPIHALVAHVSPANYQLQMVTMYRAWGDACRLLRDFGESEGWPKLSRMEPFDVVHRMNRAYTSISKVGR